MSKILLEKRASEFRRDFGLGADTPLIVENLLMDLEVLAVFKPLSHDFSGMAIKTGEENASRFILINTNHPVGKQNFTICHELYHLFIQNNFTSMICNTGRFIRKSGIEYQADLFAAYLLMPEFGIKKLVPDNELAGDKIKLRTVLRIEHHFSCSRAALLYRLKELNVITSRLYDKYCINVKRGALEQGYNIDLYEAGNHNLVIGDYGSIARELYDNEKISESHYHSLLFDLGMNVTQIEQLVNEEGG